jgi:hypothetical protein
MKLKKTPRNGLKSCKPCDYSYVYFEFSLICLNFESRHWVRRVLSGRGGFARVGLESNRNNSLSTHTIIRTILSIGSHSHSFRETDSASR